MPVSTDHLADDIRELRESQQNLAEAMQGLIREFGSFRVEVVERLGAMNTGIRAEFGEKFESLDAKLDSSRERTDAALAGIRAEFESLDAKLDASRDRTDAALTGIRVEVAERFGAINTNLEGFRGRTELALRVATWSVSLLIPLFFGLVGYGFWISWYAGRMDFRLGNVESRLDREPAKASTPNPR